MKSENELSFVLAHEMGHFANRDHLRGLGRGLVFIALSALIFGSDSGVGDFLSGWINITEMSFSREQESKADKYALNALNCTYGHVGGATDFFGKMSKEEHIGFFKHFFLSHPESKKRISVLKEYARSKDFAEGELRKLPPELEKMDSKK